MGLVVPKSKISSIYINLTDAAINGDALLTILDTDDELTEALVRLVKLHYGEE